MFGHTEMVGYGFVHLPSAPRIHRVECACWRPLSSSWYDEVQAFFVSGNPQLKSLDMIATNIDWYKLRTWTSGTVRLQLSVLLKGFKPYNFIFKGATAAVKA